MWTKEKKTGNALIWFGMLPETIRFTVAILVTLLRFIKNHMKRSKRLNCDAIEIIDVYAKKEALQLWHFFAEFIHVFTWIYASCWNLITWKLSETLHLLSCNKIAHTKRRQKQCSLFRICGFQPQAHTFVRQSHDTLLRFSYKAGRQCICGW